MYITIDELDRRPIYRQVAEEIKALIARGSLSEGMALPPVRQVADDLGVNLNTIAAAYRTAEGGFVDRAAWGGRRRLFPSHRATERCGVTKGAEGESGPPGSGGPAAH